MGRDDLVGVFVALALRPHSRCTYRSTTKLIRHASSTSPSQNKLKPIPTSPAPKPARPVIPLNVGLDRNPENLSAISRIPIPRGITGEVFVPSSLSRPLGLSTAPLPGQNSPIDTRTLRERHEEFTSYEKALERRRIYLRTYFRPYFQEWRRMDHHKGKSFVSSARLFKREKALYFPNIWGQTLVKEGDGAEGGRDTTPVLMGRVSVVAVHANRWAEEMVETFLGEKANPELSGLLSRNGQGGLQRVDVNIQGDWMRALIVKLFTSRLRQAVPEDRWSRYFMIKLPRDIRRGLTDEVRDAMGLLNSQVGYVYLIDSSCKIRWAGSGHAWEGEVEGLNAAVRRLLQEEENLGQTPVKPVVASSNAVQRPRVTAEVASKRSNPVPSAVAA